MNNSKETIQTLVKLLSEAYDREKVLNERIKALEEANRSYESIQNTQGKEFLENMAFTFANRKTFSPTEKINLIKEYRAITGLYLKDCKDAIEARFNELCIVDERDS